MSRDQTLGVVILIGAIAVIGVYGWLLISDYQIYALIIVATIAVLGVMGIIAWIGWTMATTPPPKPIEEITAEIETQTEEKATEKNED